ncbi:MAG TPA: A/G-specific adenine glycosylase [candidate division Zixibacteria bacterium]|nr:A/G-specific adenine glycosylase [candidate division Zixibacteria bacterium]
MTARMPKPLALQFRLKLLRWYDRTRRDLPWRRTRDPYAVWIAETMLQQTQVATVVPYYERFLRVLPDLAALRRAAPRRVLALWSGLGYYRRAENLCRAAREIGRRFAGKLPSEYAALRSLPGIGDYTAAAIASIAFDRPIPALDGNARRVLGRALQIRGERSLRRAAGRLISRRRPGDFNQALMDLGATICVPSRPRCPACPVSVECRFAAARGRVRPPSRSRCFRHVTWPLAVIRHDGKWLLRRRDRKGILPGLWEFPGGERSGRETVAETLRRHLSGLGGALPSCRRIGAFRHTITDRRIVAPVFLFSAGPSDRLDPPDGRWRWFTPRSLRREAISAMTAKAAALATRYEESAS